MAELSNLPLPYALERTRRGPVAITAIGDDRLMLSGRNNAGAPAQSFANWLAGLDDEQYVTETEHMIWLSAYAANNPTSDYHWQASACYYEAARRGKPELYQQAYDQARASAGL